MQFSNSSNLNLETLDIYRRQHFFSFQSSCDLFNILPLLYFHTLLVYWYNFVLQRLLLNRLASKRDKLLIAATFIFQGPATRHAFTNSFFLLRYSKNLSRSFRGTCRYIFPRKLDKAVGYGQHLDELYEGQSSGWLTRKHCGVEVFQLCADWLARTCSVFQFGRLN